MPSRSPDRSTRRARAWMSHIGVRPLMGHSLRRSRCGRTTSVALRPPTETEAVHNSARTFPSAFLERNLVNGCISHRSQQSERELARTLTGHEAEPLNDPRDTQRVAPNWTAILRRVSPPERARGSARGVAMAEAQAAPSSGVWSRYLTDRGAITRVLRQFRAHLRPVPL